MILNTTDIARKDAYRAEAYLRHYAAVKNWPRLAEIADIIQILESDYIERSQKLVDAVCHYRNLAIELGAPAEQMLNKHDRDLVKMYDPSDRAAWEDGTPDLWEELDAAEARLREVERERDEALEALEVTRGAITDAEVRLRAENERAWALLEWLAKNMPRALELCPYKVNR